MNQSKDNTSYRMISDIDTDKETDIDRERDIEIPNQSVSQGGHISQLLEKKDMDRLNECFSDVPKLLELVDNRIKLRSLQTPVKNPYGYVTAIAREEEWPTRKEAKRRVSAREARLREIEEQEQKEIDEMNKQAKAFREERERKGIGNHLRTGTEGARMHEER